MDNSSGHQLNATVSSNSSRVGCFPDLILVDVGVLLPEVVALPIFSAAIFILHRGVEIDHPVFRIILNNLIFQLTLTVIIIVGQLTVSVRKSALLVSEFVNLAGLLFHQSTWTTLSCLRYAYIVKPDWLHSKYPDTEKLRRTSQVAAFFYFLLILVTMLAIYFGSVIPLGWPKVTFYRGIPTSAKIFIVVALSLVYLSPVLISLTFYILLARASKSKMNKIGVVAHHCSAVDCQQCPTPKPHGDIFIGYNPEQNEIEVSVANRDSGHPQPPSFEAVRAAEERNSALRSIKTNLVVFATEIFVIFAIYSFKSDYQQCLNLISNAVFKTLLPILTTVANFGTVQAVLKKFVDLLFEKS